MEQDKKDAKVLVFGSLNIDYVYQVDHFVQAGETISSRSMQTFCGGKGLNQSIAFGKSGVDIWHAGAVGKGDSRMLLDALERAGVHTELIRKKDCSSGHAIIQNTPDGENCIMLYGGANQEITREEARQGVFLPLCSISGKEIIWFCKMRSTRCPILWSRLTSGGCGLY